MIEIGVFHKAVVYKKILLSPGFLSILGLTNKPVKVDDGGLLRHRNQALIVAVSKYVYNPLFKGLCWQVEQLLAIAMKREMDVGVRQRYALEFLNDMPHLHRVAFQKVTTGRNVVKQVFYADVCSRRKGFRFLAHHIRSGNFDARTQFVFHTACLKLHVGNRRDRSQRFPTETHGTDGEEIIRLPDFRRSVTLERQPRIGYAHAASIVYQLNKRFSTVLYNQFYLVGTGI